MRFCFDCFSFSGFLFCFKPLVYLIRCFLMWVMVMSSLLRVVSGILRLFFEICWAHRHDFLFEIGLIILVTSKAVRAKKQVVLCRKFSNFKVEWENSFWTVFLFTLGHLNSICTVFVIFFEFSKWLSKSSLGFFVNSMKIVAIVDLCCFFISRMFLLRPYDVWFLFIHSRNFCWFTCVILLLLEKVFCLFPWFSILSDVTYLTLKNEFLTIKMTLRSF